MAKTSAQRQAEYKARRIDNLDEKKLGIWLPIGSCFALKRLARRAGITKKDLLTRMLNDADLAVIKQLDIDTDEWNEYMKR